MTLVVLVKTVAKSDREIHGFLYLILMLGYIALNWRIKAFNYPRIWMWHFLSLFAVIWISLLALMDLLYEEHTAFVIWLFVGWVVLITVGIVCQYRYFPSFLYTRKHHDLPGLLKFAFQKGSAEDADRITKSRILSLAAKYPTFDHDKTRKISPLEQEDGDLSSNCGFMSSQRDEAKTNLTTNQQKKGHSKKTILVKKDPSQRVSRI